MLRVWPFGWATATALRYCLICQRYGCTLQIYGVSTIGDEPLIQLWSFWTEVDEIDATADRLEKEFPDDTHDLSELAAVVFPETPFIREAVDAWFAVRGIEPTGDRPWQDFRGLEVNGERT